MRLSLFHFFRQSTVQQSPNHHHWLVVVDGRWALDLKLVSYHRHPHPFLPFSFVSLIPSGRPPGLIVGWPANTKSNIQLATPFLAPPLAFLFSFPYSHHLHKIWAPVTGEQHHKHCHIEKWPDLFGLCFSSFATASVVEETPILI